TVGVILTHLSAALENIFGGRTSSAPPRAQLLHESEKLTDANGGLSNSQSAANQWPKRLLRRTAGPHSSVLSRRTHLSANQQSTLSVNWKGKYENPTESHHPVSDRGGGAYLRLLHSNYGTDRRRRFYEKQRPADTRPARPRSDPASRTNGTLQLAFGRSDGGSLSDRGGQRGRP